MASLIASAPIKSLYVTLSTTTAQTLLTLGFTEQEVKDADHVHISIIKNGDVRYWYDGITVPTGSQGHLMYEGEERIVRGIRNARNLKMISDIDATGEVELAITLGKF